MTTITDLLGKNWRLSKATKDKVTEKVFKWEFTDYEFNRFQLYLYSDFSWVPLKLTKHLW